jgi:hypothetical protein
LPNGVVGLWPPESVQYAGVDAGITATALQPKHGAAPSRPLTPFGWYVRTARKCALDRGVCAGAEASVDGAGLEVARVKLTLQQPDRGRVHCGSPMRVNGRDCRDYVGQRARRLLHTIKMSQPDFIPGRVLSRQFFEANVQPLLERAFPALPYSAGLIGPGSEVLGFDTPMSTDHHWGPRVMLFVRDVDLDTSASRIRDYLSRHLPGEFRGYSTHFSAPDPSDHGVQHRVAHAHGPVNHRVELFTIDGFLDDYLGCSLPLTTVDWLVLPSQKLRSIVAGPVYRDDLGLNAVRTALDWYPRDVWLYLLGCLWVRVGQEEHLMGRAGDVGDELGASIIGSRIVRDIMRIAYCLERQYPPYPKWFGTGFAMLRIADALQPHLADALAARRWRERAAALVRACEVLVDVQCERAIGDGERVRGRLFHGRPFPVIDGERVAAGFFSGIDDPALAELARSRRIGTIDLVSDNTDLLEAAHLATALRGLYERT